ncbi:hypothetical protein AALA98_13970 [Lachnospiraceae bacterium 45-W7]
MAEADIAYQNKDITSKMLAENFKGKSFRVYGLDLPEVRNVLPTNIPAVKANELRIDNLFELADGTAAIVDYESSYNKEDKVKYLNYLAGIANRYQKDQKECPMLRMVVIYTGDIKREQVAEEYNIGAVRMHVECAFLSELDSESILGRLKHKVERNEMLDDGELMEFIILPLSYRRKEEKQQKIRETVELAAKIQDRGQQLFALAGILAFTDKLIDRETAGRIRRVIEMTQVAQIFEEEKQQALTQVAQIFEEEKQQAIQQTAQDYKEKNRKEMAQIVIRMIQKNYSTEEIVTLVSSYSQDDVEALRKELAAEEK